MRLVLRSSRLQHLIIAAAAAAALSGCEGCQRKDKPYTPFGIASVAPPSAGASATGVASAAPDARAPTWSKKMALVARPPAARWQLKERALAAPPGRLIERGLLHDFDADGKAEALVWTVPAEPKGSPGQLYRIDADERATRLFSLPGFVPSGPGCRLLPELAVTGKATATLDVRAKCSVAMLSRAPIRSLTVLAPARSAPVVASLRIIDPGPNQPLSVDVTTQDRDADGRDDLALRVKVVHRKRTQSAQFIWFDRASGVARDVSQPRSAFLSAAGRARWSSKRSKHAANARLDVAALRRLMATTCAEGGVPRVLTEEGSPLSCGNLQLVLDRAAAADVTAALTAKDVLGAFAAYERAGWYLKAPSDKTRTSLEKSLHAAVDLQPAERVATSVTAQVHQAPGYLPLRYEPPATLWVLTDAGPRAVAADGSLAAIDEDGDGPAPWPLELKRGDGATLTGVAYACDRPWVSLSFKRQDGKLDTTSTQLLAPRPGTCRPNATFDAPSAVGLGVKGGSVALLLGASRVGASLSFADATLREQPKGAPRSPSGKYLAVPTPLGVLVASATSHRLWQLAQPWPHALVGCAVNDAASALACTDVKGGVFLVNKK